MLQANASDSDGTISKVEFYNGTTKLGEDLTSPYTFTWPSVPTGSYSLTAKGYDNSNAVATSTTVNITVNAVQPTCSDGIKNQNEVDTDCGGVCVACAVVEGSLSGTHDVTHVWLESSIPGANIYYTLDGSTPTVNSQEYFGAIELRDSKTVKAIAVLPNSNQKENFSETYTVQKSASIVTVNGPTYIEAEASKDYQNFVARPDSRASNGEYMLVLNQQNGSPSYLKYAFTASPGKYYVWARTQMQDSWGTLTVDVDGIVSP
ncbi:MAG: hypothetical protein UR92_C0014G0001, partial [Candidatus Nomurabacteria bacterium GW2011_GWA2_35_80]